MPEKGILLSKLEQEMLVSPEKLNARQKRNLNYRLKTRSSQIDQVLQELELLINNVPDDSLKETITNKTFSSIKTILERLLLIKAPWPVGVDKDDNIQIFRVFGNAIPSADLGKCAIHSVSREASYEEAELDFYLTEIYNNIRYYVDPCIPNPVCRTPDTLREETEQILKSLKELNRPFTISHNAYLDETGVDEYLWVLRKPSMVDIKQLHWMRWKPRDLKECLEQPPLFKEKKIPGKCITEASISLSSSTQEEIEKFREIIQKQNETPKLTGKELLEINERIKKIPRSEEE
jgi:hypothetical protein